MTPPSDAERARAWWDRLRVLDRWELVGDRSRTRSRVVDWFDRTGDAPSDAFVAEVKRIAAAWAAEFDEHDGWAP